MRCETRIIWDASDIAGWQWQILVERYPQAGRPGRAKASGRVRRAFESTFTPDEREKIHALYEELRRWANVTGAPNEHEMKPSEVNLLARAVAFFGTI